MRDTNNQISDTVLYNAVNKCLSRGVDPRTIKVLRNTFIDGPARGMPQISRQAFLDGLAELPGDARTMATNAWVSILGSNHPNLCRDDEIYSPWDNDRTSLIGEFSGKHPYVSACLGNVSFKTNGRQGGDAGHGGYLDITFEDEGGTALYVIVDGQEYDMPNKTTLRFRGDCEIQCAIECLQFLVTQLTSEKAKVLI